MASRSTAALRASTAGGGLASSSKGAGNSSHRRAPMPGENSNRPQIVDPSGRYLTPKPLIPSKDTHTHTHTHTAAAAAARQRSLAASAASAGSDGDDGSTDGFSGGGFGAHTGGYADDETVSVESEREGKERERERERDREVEAGATGVQDEDDDARFGSSLLMKSRITAGVPIISEAEAGTLGANGAALDALVTLLLEETPTHTLLHMPATRVQQDTVEYRQVVAANERYEALKSGIARAGAEMYPSRATDTLNPATKHKDVMTVRRHTASVEVQATSWDIFDRSHGAGGGMATDAELTSAAKTAALERHVDAMVSVALATPGCLIDAEGSVRLVPPLGGSASFAGNQGGGGAAAGRSGPGMRGSMLSSTVTNGSAAKGGATPGKGSNASKLQPRASAANLNASASGSVGGALSASGADGTSFDAGSVGNESKRDVADTPTEGSTTLQGDGSTLYSAIGTLDINAIADAEQVLASRSLLDSLSLMERAVQQNIYHAAHRRYRAGPGAEAVERLLSAGLAGGHEGAAAAMAALEVAALNGGEGGVRSPRRRAASGYGYGAEDDAELDDLPQSAGMRAGSSPSAGGAASGLGDVTADGAGVAAGEEERAQSVSASLRAPQGSAGPPAPTTAGGLSAGRRPHGDFTAEAAPTLTKLWSYTCKQTEGLNVSCMTWNHTNRDLLAVGYGPYDYAAPGSAAAKQPPSSTRGVIAVWSMSNPEHPQAILKTVDDVGVTALDFSASHPNLLAAGMIDGRIAVYDVRKIMLGESDGSPGLISDALQTGAHTEAVWQVKWVSKSDFGEVLVSISTDGRVTQWDCKKGMAPTLLMTLKRARGAGLGALAEAAGVSSAAGSAAQPAAVGASADALGAGGSEGILARTTSGLTFDFVPSDTTNYFVGTEDGLVARCSTSYTEQYLEVIPAHAGPVNRIRISPFIPSALLTCSADWTAKLWSMPASGSGALPKATVYSTDAVTDAVADIAWSPSVSTIFASVTRDGHIQLWDVGVLNPMVDAIVTLDPAIWRARLEAEAAARAAADAAAAAEARRRRRAELGEDDDELDQAAAAAAAAELVAVTRGESMHGRGREESVAEDEDAKIADNDSASDGEDSLSVRARNPPRKKLSCVLFADNTHVLVTGDDTGAVDVYRITGLDEALDPSGSGVLGGGSGTAAAIGSEIHEAQLAALQEVLDSMGQ